METRENRKIYWSQISRGAVKTCILITIPIGKKNRVEEQNSKIYDSEN